MKRRIFPTAAAVVLAAPLLALALSTRLPAGVPGTIAAKTPASSAAPAATVRAAVPRNFPPYYVYDETAGAPGGLAIDAFNAVARKAGLRPEYLVLDSWGEALAAVRAGRAEVIPNLGITGERKAFLDFTRPFAELSISLFTHKGDRGIRDLSDLEGRAVGAVEMNMAVKLLRARRGVRLRVYPGPREMIFALLTGEIDAMAHPAPHMEALLREMGLEGKVVETGSPLAEVRRAIAVRKGREKLLRRLDASLAELMPTEAFRAILLRWERTKPAAEGHETLHWGLLAALILALLVAGTLAYFVLRDRRARPGAAATPPEAEAGDLPRRLFRALADAPHAGFIFPFLLEELCSFLPCDRIVLATRDQKARTIRIWHEEVPSPLPPYTPEEAEDAAQWFDEVYARGRPAIIEDLAKADRPFARRLARAGYRGLLSMPIAYGGRVIAHLSATSRRPGVFTEAHGRILTEIARYLAFAVNNALAHERARARERRFAALVDVTARLTQSPDIRCVLDSVAEETARLFEGEANFRLVEDGHLVRVNSTPTAENMIAQERIPLGESISGLVAITKTPISTPDLAADPRAAAYIDPEKIDPERTGALLSVPILAEEECIGTLLVYREKGYRFTDEDQELAMLLGRQVGQLIHNERQREEFRRSLRESEAKFRGLADGALDGVVLLDSRSRVVFWNATAERLFGYTKEEAEGKNLAELIIPPEFRKAHQEGYREFAATGEGEIIGGKLILDIIRKDGRRIPMEHAISAIRLGDEWHAIGICRDISDRLSFEERLRTLSRAIEQASEMVMVTDTDGRIEFVNPAFTEMTGYSAGEVRGQTPRILKSGETPPETYRRLWETIKGGGVWRGEFHNKRKDGTLFWASATISPIRNEAGEISHFIGVQQDITERKAAEEKLKATQKMLIRTERLSTIGTLTAGATHEILNPANIIGLYAQRLQWESEEGSPERETADVIVRNVDRIAKICDDLRRFSRDEKVEFAPFDLAAAVADALRPLEKELPLLNIETEVDLPPEAEGAATVMGDRAQIQQVLLNLFSNARDAMPEGGRLTVRVRAVEKPDEGRWWEVRVTDTGEGIPEDVLPRIFDPFFTTKPQEKGTGLGLSVSHGIIEDHGGEIRAESTPGEGATFVIMLPVHEEEEAGGSDGADSGGG